MLNSKSKIYILLSLGFKIGIIYLFYLYKLNINTPLYIIPIVLILIGILNSVMVDTYINFAGLLNSLYLYRTDIFLKLLSIYSIDIFIKYDFNLILYFNIFLLMLNLIIEILLALKINEIKFSFKEIKNKILDDNNEYKSKIATLFLNYFIWVTILLNIFDNKLFKIIVYFIISMYFNKASRKLIRKLKRINTIKFNIYWIINSLLMILAYIFISKKMIFIFLAINYLIVSDAICKRKTSIFDFDVKNIVKGIENI